MRVGSGKTICAMFALRAFFKEKLIDKAFIISDFFDSHLLDINPALLYSGSMPDSVKSGKDAYYNGVKYTNTVMFLSCHATAADSLMMVKKYVYRVAYFFYLYTFLPQRKFIINAL